MRDARARLFAADRIVNQGGVESRVTLQTRVALLYYGSMSAAISGAQRRRDGMPKGRPFKKGESGNPSGRPKALGEITELARQHSPAAIAALVKALDDPERAIPAAIALLDRAWGKPPVALVAQVQANVWPGGIDGPPPIEGSWEEWLAQRRQDLGLDPPAGPSGRETEKQWVERRNHELDLLTSDRSQH